MATSNISNGDAAANKGSFSYAQAAKGSSAPPTPSLQSESNTWSGAADPSTSSDDPSHGLDVSSSKNGDAESSSSTSTKDEKAAPSVVSDLAASSVLAGKDEDTISDVTSRSESAVEQSFQQAASGVQTPETSEEKEVPRGKGKKKSEAKEKAEQAEKPAPIPLKEAPMPSVNIWQQRAQEAKQKQPASTSSVSEKVQPLTTTNSKSMEGASAPAGQTQQTRSPSHPQRDEGASRSLPLPPRNDAMSWPTPLSAQEVQEKSDKEKPGTSTAPTKSHGKSEWKPVPYTPSVKFNTPMPAIRGKTARTGARGGRMAGPGDRTTPMLPNGHTNEVEGDFKPRAKSEGGLMRSSTLPSNSRRPAGGHGSTENPSTSVAESSAVASTTNHGATTENGDSQQGFAPGEMASGSLASGDIGNGAMSAQSANGELATAAADPSSTTTQQSKVPRRRGSHAAGASEFAGGEKKRAPESGVAGDRPSWIETREKGEGRKESWPVSQRERPDGRPERGRGHKGSRGLHSQAPHMGLAQYGMPQGMIAGHHSKNPSFTYYPPGPPQASRGYRQGRASMPVDGNFARFGFPAGQPYMDYSYPNAMYGYQAPLPASTFSYAPQMEQQVIISAISVQLSYYFSLDNLVKDVFLRKHMDSQGFVYLSLVGSFKRIKDLTTDLEMIKFVCLQSDELEVRLGPDGRDKIRRKTDWEKWVMPLEDRDESAKNDGPPKTEHPQASYSGVYAQPFHHPQMAQHVEPSPHTNAGHFDHFPQGHGFSPVPVTPSKLNGSKSPTTTHIPEQHSTQSDIDQSLPNGDSAPEQQADSAEHEQENQDLLVAVKPINGSEAVNGDSTQSVETTAGERLNRVLQRPSGTRKQSHLAAGCYWIREGNKEKYLPLPSDADFIPYEQLHHNALHQRRIATHGQTPYDMNILYNFWSHYLVRDFNPKMYDEFSFLAHDDMVNRSSTYGMHRLQAYYHKALVSDFLIQDQVAMDYASFVQAEDSAGDYHALPNLRSAWRNGATNMRNRKKLGDYMKSELKAELDR